MSGSSGTLVQLGEQVTRLFGRHLDADQREGTRQDGIPARREVSRRGQQDLSRSHAVALEPATVGQEDCRVADREAVEDDAVDTYLVAIRSTPHDAAPRAVSEHCAALPH